MHRISPNNPVRRRLFSDDADEARVDNFANVLQESIKLDREQKKQKWNFDFENEVPLEGDYEWHRCENNDDDWIGVKSDTKIEESEEQESFLSMKNENEITPKNNKEDESAPLLRKRKKEVDSPNDKGVRRKISFD